MNTTILIRAALTQDEWIAFRGLALRERVAVKDLSADAIRALLRERNALPETEASGENS